MAKKDWSVRKVLVTPELAAKWLARNVNPRKMRPAHVAFLCRIAQAGSWGMDASAIVFDWAGNLINGQHRLTMVVQTGMSFEFVVIVDADPACAPHLDTGIMVRSLADTIALVDKNAVNTTTVAAVCQLLWRYQNTSITDSARLSGHEIVETFEDHPDVVRSVRLLKTSSPCAGSNVAFVHYLAATADPAAADAWVNALMTGCTPIGCPARALREYLLKTESSFHGSKDRGMLIRGLMRNFNSFRAGESYARFVMNNGSEKVPVIQGCKVHRAVE